MVCSEKLLVVKYSGRGHHRSLISVAIESAYALMPYSSKIVTLVLSCPVSELLQVFCQKATPPLFHAKFRDVPLGLGGRYWDSEERRPYDVYLCN